MPRTLKKPIKEIEMEATKALSNGGNNSNIDKTDKVGKRSLLFRTLSPDMLEQPHEIKINDDVVVNSKEFVFEKTAETIVRPLKFGSKRQWLDFAAQVWEYVEVEIAAQQAIALDRLFEQAKDNPALDRLLREKIDEVYPEN